jgi:hypothetical protein
VWAGDGLIRTGVQYAGPSSNTRGGVAAARGMPLILYGVYCIVSCGYSIYATVLIFVHFVMVNSLQGVFYTT